MWTPPPEAVCLEERALGGSGSAQDDLSLPNEINKPGVGVGVWYAGGWGTH